MLGAILKHPAATKTLFIEVRFIHGTIQKYLEHNRNIFPPASSVRTFLTRYTRMMQPAHFLKPSRMPQSLLRHQQMSQFDVNMNVQNNVILYKYENYKYFRNVHIFAITQLVGWLALIYWLYTPKLLEIFTTDIKFKEYINRYPFRLFTIVTSITMGSLMYSFIYVLCSRSIKHIVLNKGGKTVSIVTYHLWKKKPSMNVPVNMVKCYSHRTEAGGFLSLKIKNKPLFYMIDKKGMFLNPKLFDYTMG